MQRSDSIAALATALAAAQGDITTVAKDRTNPHFKNTYATLDAIIAATRPALAKQGLSVLQGAERTVYDSDGRPCALTVESMLLHKSGEWIANAVTVPLAKVDPQGAGSALTYGRRYSMSALLTIATDDDDDANGATVRHDIEHPRPQPVGNTGPRAMPSSAVATGDADDPACPKCSGPMWDNRGTPSKPKLNPKAPDWKCKDAACAGQGGVIWPPKAKGA